MVSTKLVDPRSSPAWNGWSLFLIEVHHRQLAPFPALERFSKWVERVDTIPHIRSLGTVAVVGDTLVIGAGGNSATAFTYDVRTKQLTRFPQPDWLNMAVVTPPPAFSPDGRFIAYISQDGSSRLTVRTWPDGRLAYETPPIQPRQMTRPDGGMITWANPEQVYAHIPVSDSGPSWASFAGQVRNGTIEPTRWQIYADSRLVQNAAVTTQLPAVTDYDLQSIHRLAPAAFSELPTAFIRELEQLGCTIPQSDYTGTRGNVIHGNFAVRGQEDWAVLCSRGGSSVIRLWWGGLVQCPREIALAEDKFYLQGLGAGKMGFSRGISARNTYYDYTAEDSVGVGREFTLEHDGIDDAFQGKASSVRFCRGGAWLVFGGAD